MAVAYIKKKLQISLPQKAKEMIKDILGNEFFTKTMLGKLRLYKKLHPNFLPEEHLKNNEEFSFSSWELV